MYPKQIIFPLLISLSIFCVTIHTANAAPNIILIMADDLGYGDLSSYSEKGVPTPNIDRLAREGLRFTDFHSNGVVCSPTRAALMTGRYQQRTGITGVITAKGPRTDGLEPEELTFAEVAKEAGYATAMFGKWHTGYLPKFNPIHQGFDEFIGFVSGNVDYFRHIDQEGHEDWWHGDKLQPEEGYTTDLITKHGVDFIKRKKDEPFLLYLAHESPHYPFQTRDSGPAYAPGKGKDPKLTKALGPKKDAYGPMIQALDDGVGAVLDALEAAGIAENTLVIFKSDNGPGSVGSAGPLNGRKGHPLEGGHRVPTIAWWPQTIAPGTTSDAVGMSMDFLPTVAEIVGQELPSDLKIDGISLLDHFKSAKPLPERVLFWGTKRGDAVRQGSMKLIVSSKKTNLFDLETDIGEKKDLSKDQPERVQNMLKLLEEWRAEVGP